MSSRLMPTGTAASPASRAVLRSTAINQGRSSSAPMAGPVAKHAGPGDDVFQFADVAGPVIIEQQFLRVAAQRAGLLLQPLGGLLEESGRPTRASLRAGRAAAARPAARRSIDSTGRRGTGRRRLRPADRGWSWPARGRRPASSGSSRRARTIAPARPAAAWPAARVRSR